MFSFNVMVGKKNTLHRNLSQFECEVSVDSILLMSSFPKKSVDKICSVDNERVINWPEVERTVEQKRRQ